MMSSLKYLKGNKLLLGFVDEKKVKEKKEDGDASLLQSNIWTTLFRGGFANNGKLQRSLSGHHVSLRMHDRNSRHANNYNWRPLTYTYLDCLLGIKMRGHKMAEI